MIIGLPDEPEISVYIGPVKERPELLDLISGESDQALHTAGFIADMKSSEDVIPIRSLKRKMG